MTLVTRFILKGTIANMVEIKKMCGKKMYVISLHLKNDKY